MHFRNVAARYQAQTGNTLKLSYGSSGNFFSQISNGAPFDLYFSADIEYPRKLEAAGLTEPGSTYQYAVGRIVLWVPNASKLDLKRGLTALLDSDVRKIAIANPRHAPYGRAAVAAMKHDAVYDQLEHKFVLGEDISQTAQFVQSGNADAGIVALSLALAPPMVSKGRYVEIPSADYPPIIQACVVLKSSHHKAAAVQFVNFLKEAMIVAVMARYGFSLPSPPNRM